MSGCLLPTENAGQVHSYPPKLSITRDSNDGTSIIASISELELLQPHSFRWSVNGLIREEDGRAITIRGLPADSILVKVEVIDLKGALISADSASIRPFKRPAVKITTATAATIFQPIVLKFELSNYMMPVKARWHFGDGTSVLLAGSTSTHIYYQPGLYTVTCAVLDSVVGQVVARDTSLIEISSSSIILDKMLLRTFTKIEFRFEGDSKGDWWEPGSSGVDLRDHYGLTLPLNSDVLVWNDSGASFSLGAPEYDTVDNGGWTLIQFEERSQRVDVVVNGDKLQMAYGRNVYNHGFWGQGYSSMTKGINEFRVGDLELVYQSQDSMVFAIGGEQLRDHFYMYSENSETQSPNPNFNSGRIYRFTDFRSVDPRPVCRVKFFK
jgi:hypothetical protein